MWNIEIYLLLFLLIFTINVVPAFMPPTWIVLSLLYIHFNLSFFPTVFLAVVAATSGRILLALFARNGLSHILPKNFLARYRDLGTYLKGHQHVTIPVVLGYAFSPISSNSLFIMAGLSDLNLKVIAISFSLGRLLTYSFWITTTYQLSRSLNEIFAGSFRNAGGILSALVSLLIIMIIGNLNWKKFLHIEEK